MLFIYFVSNGYLTASIPKKSSSTFTCRGSVCELKQDFLLHPESVLLNANLLIRHNIVAQGKVFTSIRYFLIAPIIDLYIHGLFLGSSVGVKQTFLPTFILYGPIELSAILLSDSLYYSFLVALVRLWKRRNLSWIRSVVMQIAVIILLLATAALIEAYGFSLMY